MHLTSWNHVFIAMVALGGLAAPAAAQTHGAQISVACETPTVRGHAMSCTGTVGHNDDFGDTIDILEAWAIIDPAGSAIRVPETGSLPPVLAIGNTSGLGPLPITVGDANSSLNGLPGSSTSGEVSFLMDSYVVGPDDPNPLVIQFNYVVIDNCDDPNTRSCFSFHGLLQFTAATEVIDCPGDTDGNAIVNVNDIVNIILDWGTDGSANGGDVTGATPGSPPDGTVDVNDLNAVIVGWGACR